ncbi:MAG: hypothetical protein RLZZ426_659 [Actinomycetota bacterium]
MNIFVVPAVLFGLAIGSFINVVVYRLPRNESVIRPRSACPECGCTIAWFDNIPILSWILLRARCRVCGARISFVYPVIEFTLALMFGLTAHLSARNLDWDTNAQAVASLLIVGAFAWLCAIGVALTAIDVRTNELPNKLVLSLYLVGIPLLTTSSLINQNSQQLVRAFFGLLILGLFYSSLSLFISLGMGMGDVKLSGILGFYLAWLSWGSFIVGSLAAFGLGAGAGLTLIAVGKANRKSSIAFGPWMLLGAGVGALWGHELWSSYISVINSTLLSISSRG